MEPRVVQTQAGRIFLVRCESGRTTGRTAGKGIGLVWLVTETPPKMVSCAKLYEEGRVRDITQCCVFYDTAYPIAKK